MQAPTPSFVSVRTGVQITFAFHDEFADLLAIGRLSRGRNYLCPSGVASHVTDEINKKGHLKVTFSVLWWRRREFNWTVKPLFCWILTSQTLALCPQPSGPVGDSRTGPSAVTGAPTAAQAERAPVTPAQSRALLPSLGPPWCRYQSPDREAHCR